MRDSWTDAILVTFDEAHVHLRGPGRLVDYLTLMSRGPWHASGIEPERTERLRRIRTLYSARRRARRRRK